MIVTATPTPPNALTAVALAPQITGTATPVPPDWATPIIITAVPPPANGATATYQAQVATAEARLFGTATPTPNNIWTTTPTPNRIMVTSTPMPENVITRAALAAQATNIAETVGTYTPVPGNWATPFVVTPVPAAGNEATAEFFSQVATAESFLYGLIWTATPTAIAVTTTPVPTFTPTPSFQTIPSELVGKILFLSDRAGAREDTGLTHGFLRWTLTATML